MPPLPGSTTPYEAPPIQSTTPRTDFDLDSIREPPDLWGSRGLTIVGTGIRGGLQTTPEARICIEQASKVLYLVGDSVSEQWLLRLNPRSVSLYSRYSAGRPRKETYLDIVEEILRTLRNSSDVCVVFYGHPAVFVGPGLEAMRRARAEGFPVRMLPGVSALDNLFSDLGLDPGATGLQCYEATGYLLYDPQVEPTAALLLLQVGVVGERGWTLETPPRVANLARLRDSLLKRYRADHPLVIYEAADQPFGRPRIDIIELQELPRSKLSKASTVFVPPLPRGEPNQGVLRSFDPDR